MRPLALAIACALAAPSAAAGAKGVRAEVVLDGERVPVRWTDGDSFRVLGGAWRGRNARLAGVNALEAFGPVHRWGGWTREELYAIAASSAAVAAAEPWACRAGRPDRYGRLLVDCPAAAEALVRAGHAMAFAVDRPAAPPLLAAQAEAQRRGAGMWAKGVPAAIVTSVHSADEPDLGGGAYDRLADTRTGETRTIRHGDVRAVCEDVCHGEGTDRSCMLHVPFARRYRDRPACLPRPPRVR